MSFNLRVELIVIVTKNIKKKLLVGWALIFSLVCWAVEAPAFHLDIYVPRVPSDLLEEIQDMDNPYEESPEIIEKGKKYFLVKGFA